MKNKKGVSLIVSYVLLVIITVSLGAIVYSYLKTQLPGEKAECPSDINLIIEEASCSGNKLNVTFSNRGLFNVSGVFVRLDSANRTARRQVNNGSEIFINPLRPGGVIEFSYNIPSSILSGGSANYVLEIQAASLVKRTLVPCKGTVITQPLECNV
ncbi:hypothetical protein HYV50_05575 [Candidatus Pacearchaeota archaeon]|nr:hypothetical protein [Candidatus Pacearchaeota archaeon]